jgi:predicted RNA-binding protein
MGPKIKFWINSKDSVENLIEKRNVQSSKNSENSSTLEWKFDDFQIFKNPNCMPKHASIYHKRGKNIKTCKTMFKKIIVFQ